ncbi:hypothetical protein GCM10011571_23250 [Marinithermofilum abyssi]|uniref:Tetratricopeptide repeat-containing protein n=1 Tax=Marinithermofilum abyssi TaxID=1571185 RepID=A0A8J2YAV5_9BACL|nr:tetratricopeptide repeat protein [Marinithermofilum abyssi]GGE20623.1 hypothetical protein GCM10011571_23250 [Marinithermofilum abyssi]
MTAGTRIPLYDELGQMIWIDREEFRQRVIPENMQAEWDHAEGLYTLVVQVFRDGFLEEAGKGADRLLELTERQEGALLVKALVHLRQKQYGDAEAVLQECIERFPDRGVAYTYLAKVYANREEKEKVLPALIEGLKREPNQETALRMLTRWCNSREQAEEILKELASQPDAWWPQLELGKLYLDLRQESEAMDRFRAALDLTRSYRVDEEFPEWEEEVAAMTVTANLRKKGWTDALIRFCEDYWTPKFITPFIGTDYAQALEEKGEIKQAVETLHQMVEYVRPEYQPMLHYRMHQLEKKALLSRN